MATPLLLTYCLPMDGVLPDPRLRFVPGLQLARMPLAPRLSLDPCLQPARATLVPCPLLVLCLQLARVPLAPLPLALYLQLI